MTSGTPPDRSGPAPAEAGWAVGLMTGTALDGVVDAALLYTDGVEILKFGPWLLHPYGEALREQLAQATAAARRWAFHGPAPALFAAVTPAYTRACAEAVAAVLRAADLRPAEVRVVGMHGQTVLHRAPAPGVPGATCQLGDGALLATLTGIDVVARFRQADVAAGGQGAPLAPVYHAALLRRAELPPPAAVLNLGGVANITWWDGGEGLYAFDTGPANGPLNDWVARHGAGRMDADGALARRGRVDEGRLAALLRHTWFDQPPPKSLDRHDFEADMADGLSLEDGAATLTAFSAAAVARGLALLPAPPRTLVLCGGGRHNPVLCDELRRRTGCRVRLAEDVGWRGDAVEAECFAYLAARCRRGLPISFPGTTGVAAPMAGGERFDHAAAG